MPLTKALIIDRDASTPTQIPVMFNPPEYQLQITNQFAEVGIPGLGSSGTSVCERQRADADHGIVF